MRNIFLPCFIFVTVLSFCILSAVFVSQTTESTIAILDHAVEAHENNTLEETEFYLAQAYSLWSQKTLFLGIVLEHNSMDEIMTELSRLRSYAVSDDHDDFLSNCEALKTMLKHIRDMQWPKTENIL